MFKIKYKDSIITALLLFLFLLQGTKNIGFLILLAFLLLFLFTVDLKNKIPFFIVSVLMVYLPFLLIGFFNMHEGFFIGVKFQLFFFFFLLILTCLKDYDFLKLFLILNKIVFIIYILLYVGLFPNFWSESTFGFEGRVYGPPITAIIFVEYIYIIENKNIDRQLILAFTLGVIYILLTSNFMDLLIVAGLFGLMVFNFKKIFKGLFVLFILGVVIYLFRNHLPGGIALKLNYISRPWEYGSVMTRITDLVQVLANTKFTVFNVLFGEGFGVTSTVYRVNEIAPSLSRYITFIEIDNGFYYLFHRGGIILLLIFTLSHIILLRLIPSLKARLAFILIVLITNLFSIHYYVYWFYLYLSFIIINKYGYKKRIFRLSLKI